MRAPDINHYVRQVPFRPFRLTLTDGRTYDIRHPDMAIAGRSSVVVGLPPSGSTGPGIVRLVTVSLLHVMQIEELPSAASPTNGQAVT
ncbi:MAG: hypothetical protein K2W96_05950 [Gemmataceae bacterium]|nr:hypothetical protein [Gemmataceae bacterium]